MKTYKTAKAILRHSLLAIEDGAWCKGDLYEVTEEKFDPSAGEWGRYICTLKEKPMGCALGHIATFAGHTTKANIEVTDGTTSKVVKVEVPLYPGDRVHKEASPGLIKARAALVNAIPKKSRITGDPDFDDNRNLDYIVADYNDSKTMGQKRAAAWFRRALELV